SLHISRFILRRMVWTSIAPFRRLLVPFEQSTAIHRLLLWSQLGYFPIYKVLPISVPILHILAAEEPDLSDNRARFGWRTVARRGIEERVVPLDHSSLFHESNLPGIVKALIEWIGPGPEVDMRQSAQSSKQR
ncbi:MAG: hypothetical protein WA634_10800, partial [Silvibacterium sp.]